MLVACNGNELPPEPDPTTPTENLPAAAKTIQSAGQNVCPSTTVELFVPPIANATSYIWFRDDVQVAETEGNAYQSTASGQYAVAGKNEHGTGDKSATHLVNIAACNVVGAVDAITLADPSNLSNCAMKDNPQVRLTVAEVSNAQEYVWFFAETLQATPTEIQRRAADSTDATTHYATHSGIYYAAAAANGSEGGRAYISIAFSFDSCVDEPPLQPEWNSATTATICTDSTFTLSVASNTGEAPGNRYLWYEKIDGSYTELPSPDNSAVLRLAKSAEGTYIFAAKIINAKGLASEQSADRNVEVVSCYVAEDTTKVTWAKIPDTATFTVHDRRTNGSSTSDNEHTVTIQKQAPNLLLVKGLGGARYANGVLRATFDEELQTFFIKGDSVGGVAAGISYDADKIEVINSELYNPIWITGPTTRKTDDGTIITSDIVGTMSFVNGKITIFLPMTEGQDSYGTTTRYTYQYWARGQYSVNFDLRFLGVDASLYGGSGTATVIQQE
jgi:hypothetical protein